MRYLIITIFLLALSQTAYAQNSSDNPHDLIPLENGYFLEIIPAKYVTQWAETPEEYKTPQYEWVTIPAVYENYTETEIVQDAYVSLKVIPAVRADDGTVLQAAELSLENIPAVTRTVTRRVEKTPARHVKRTIPSFYHPGLIRKRVKDPAYILRNAEQVEIARFEDPKMLLAEIDKVD